MAAVVDVAHLGDIGELREQRLEAAVVMARAAVQQDQRGLGAQCGAVGHQGGAVDVDEKPNTRCDADLHRSVVNA